MHLSPLSLLALLPLLRCAIASQDLWLRDDLGLYERAFDWLEERDTDDLWERDLELDERDVEDLYGRDVNELYARAFLDELLVNDGLSKRAPMSPVAIKPQTAEHQKAKEGFDKLHQQYTDAQTKYNNAGSSMSQADKQALAKQVYQGRMDAREFLIKNQEHLKAHGYKPDDKHNQYIRLEEEGWYRAKQ